MTVNLLNQGRMKRLGSLGAQSCRASRRRAGMNSSGSARDRDRHDHLMRGGFGDIPTTTLFPFLNPADEDSLHRTARAVDEARRDGDTTNWDWFPEHAAFPGRHVGTPIILGLDVIEHVGEGDQLEFLLQVVWTDLGQLAVDAAANVACWCRTEHATHDVDALTVVVSNETPLPEAFRAAATQLASWLAEPHDADYWRAKAGLPPR
ncbi:hypothetical protein ABZS59_36080 [Streptomyces flaveolus]|uniref:hypothetical protein n=1 Tax=Streptomyces flaveolus TaxID=67297 RepID=UPI0033BB4CF2